MGDRADGQELVFEDRREAGRRLAGLLLEYQGRKCVLVLALPRGGVPVAAEVARRLKLPLSVFVARKLGAPHEPEFGIGAMAEGGEVVWDERAIEMLEIGQETLDQLIDEEEREMKRRVEEYRGGKPLPEVKGKTVILVDDGLATGVTALVAIKTLVKLRARKMVLAVPVCAYKSTQQLADKVDELVCVAKPYDFVSVGRWYRNFGQTTDEEVVKILKKYGE